MNSTKLQEKTQMLNLQGTENNEDETGLAQASFEAGSTKGESVSAKPLKPST